MFESHTQCTKKRVRYASFIRYFMPIALDQSSSVDMLASRWHYRDVLRGVPDEDQEQQQRGSDSHSRPPTGQIERHARIVLSTRVDDTPPVPHRCHNVEFEHKVQGQPPLQPCVNLMQGTKRSQGGGKISWPNVDASSDFSYGGYKVPKRVDVVI